MSCDRDRAELRGFESLTPSMRTRCATGLRYSPWNGSQPSKPSAPPVRSATPGPARHDPAGPHGAGGPEAQARARAKMMVDICHMAPPIDHDHSWTAPRGAVPAPRFTG
jgi:hypothetical protein